MRISFRRPALALGVGLFLAVGSARAQARAPAPEVAAPGAAAPGAPAPGAPAVTAPDPERAKLEERLRKLEARAAADDVLIEQLKKQGDRSVLIRPFEVASGVHVHLQMLLQVDAVVYRQSSQDEVNPSTGASLNYNRFVVRRGRPRIFVESKHVTGVLMLDGSTTNGPSVRVLEAEGTLRWPAPEEGAPPYVALGLGLFRTPFGFELQQQARNRLFQERSNAARAMFASSFDLGMRVHGGYRFLRYSAAVMNGNPVGSGTYELVDPSKSKDLVLRIGVDTTLGSHGRVEVGFSGVTGEGFHRGTPSTKDTFTWRDDNGNGTVDATELIPISGAAASPSQSFSRFALGVDARVTLRPTSLGELVIQGELYRGSNMDRTFFPSDPIASGRNLRQLGWNVGVAQQLTRYAAVGVRYDTYDPDTDAVESSPAGAVPAPRTFSTWSFTGAAIYPPGRLIVQYDVNRNPYGRDATGRPTTLADDTLTIRGEVAF